MHSHFARSVRARPGAMMSMMWPAPVAASQLQLSVTPQHRRQLGINKSKKRRPPNFGKKKPSKAPMGASPGRIGYVDESRKKRGGAGASSERKKKPPKAPMGASPGRRPPNLSTDASSARKKKPSKVPMGASPGRIAYVDESRKKKGGATKFAQLCSGCGVEIVSGGGGRGGGGQREQKMATGEETRQEGRSKAKEKRARYVDAVETASSGILCNRCKSLQHGDVWNAYDALKDVDADVFSSQLSHIVSRRNFGLCILVADATDPEFSAARKLRDSIKGTPCILALNKIDLMPRMSPRDVGYLKRQIQRGKGATQSIGAFGVSAETGRGMIDLAEAVLDKIQGRDVFVVGSANVGKSTLVKSLSSLLARTLRFKGRDHNKRKDVLQNLKVTASHLPGTTLQAVRIPCFPSRGHALWDTPGIINKGALAYSLFPSHLMEPLAYPSPLKIPSVEDGTRVRVGVGQSILIEAGWVNADESDEFEGKERSEPFTLARLDVTEDGGVPVGALAFIPESLRIRVTPTTNAPEVSAMPKSYIAKVQAQVGGRGNFDATDISKPLAVYKGDGFGVTKDGHVIFEKDDTPSGWTRRDIVFAGLGFVMLEHRRSFAVRPWVVEGSLWLKRQSLYPSNLEDQLAQDEESYDGGSDDVWQRAHLPAVDLRRRNNVTQAQSQSRRTGSEFTYLPPDGPELELIKQRLQDAYQRGKGNDKKKGKRERHDDEDDWFTPW